MQCIDPGSQSKVLGGQSACGMCAETKRDFAPANVYIRMVISLLGEAGNSYDKIDGLHEAIALKCSCNLGVVERPAIEFGEFFADIICLERFDHAVCRR